jgi:hypothetical protein
MNSPDNLYFLAWLAWNVIVAVVVILLLFHPI